METILWMAPLSHNDTHIRAQGYSPGIPITDLKEGTALGRKYTVPIPMKATKRPVN